MTKPKPRPARAVDAVQEALDRQAKSRADRKPIEIVKAAICAYQAYCFSRQNDSGELESPDRAGLRRGTQASVDRLLFNVNYWRSAYEDRIAEACSNVLDADEQASLLNGISAWNSHTMRLNTLSQADVRAIFERFCPPFSINARHGGADRAGSGKGPVHDFKLLARKVELLHPELADALEQIVADIDEEARVYEGYDTGPALDALYDLLPAWCLQDTIELVRATWWNDVDVMALVADRLCERFIELGFAQSLCSYFLDVMRESIDNYSRTVSSEESPLRNEPLPHLVKLVHDARSDHPNYEIEGYGEKLPAWLDSKEQLIWNTIVCAIYDPMHARPLLVDDLALLPVEGKPTGTDVITDLAQRAYQRYLATRRESGISPEFETYESQPESLRFSGLARIESIPHMLEVLGFRIVPLSSCYPEQRIDRFRASEVECLAILEHRRWFAERTDSGWTYAPVKNVEAKQSPYLVDWDDLPDRAREWNRSVARDIPALLASVGLAISN